MTFVFYKFVLPLLLGYSLFMGISGRLNPISVPIVKHDRSSWMLGVWVALAVGLVLAISTKVIHGTPLDTAQSLSVPTASLLAGLVLPALALFGYYRYRDTKSGKTQEQSRFDWVMNEDELEHLSRFETTLVPDLLLDETCPEPFSQQTGTADVSPTYLETVQVEQLHSDTQREAVNDPDDTAASGIRLCSDEVPEDRSSDSELSAMLKTETALREETEKHLRITRKALAVLEVETRDLASRKTDEQVDLEEKLAESRALAATLEADALQEKAARLENEQRVLELKQKVIKAKQEIRRSAAARARALSTANKSIAFARQSVQIRTRLEAELEEAHEAIENRQKTISSLIRTLEKEKRRTQEDIASAARQMILHERQLKARRSLEGVARSVENKLTSRLVKKVAKGRPLISDINHGKLS